MTQQRSALVKHYQMFQLSATITKLCPQRNRHWTLINHLINYRLLDA